MKIGNISNNTSFRNIYGVVGDKKDMTKLRIFVADAKKTSKNPAMVYNLTNQPNMTKLSENKQSEKQFCIVVTGEETIKATNNLVGYNLSSFLIHSTDKIINLGNNVKADAIEILQAIKNNK